MPNTLDMDQETPVPMREREEKRRRRGGAIWWWGAIVIALAILGSGIYYTQSKSHAAKEKIENAYVFRIDGKDAQSRAASFDLVILTDEYTWVKGSSTEVVSRGATIPADEAANRIFTPQIRSSLVSDSNLIAVGLASSEGDREKEEARAIARAQTEAKWLSQIANPGTLIWTLTLGQYNKACKQQEDVDTSFERPVIVAGVAYKADGTNLQEALGDALSGHDNLPSRECYTRFDMTKSG